MSTQSEIHAATLRAHRAIEKLDKASVEQLIALYKDAAGEIAARIRALAGANDLIEYLHLQSLKQQVDQILTGLETSRNTALREAINRAAQLGVAPWDPVAVAQGLQVPVSAAAMRINQQAVKFVSSFIGKDGLQLSDRIWRIDSGARATIQNAIGRAVVMGQGAAEAATELLSRGQVVTRGITDKAREASATRLSNHVKDLLAGKSSPMTNALRLMRTEINRAHGEAYMAAGERDPEFAGFKFNLSVEHPYTDICDLLASQNLFGLGPGVYPSREFTPFPVHPNHFSFITTIFKSDVDPAWMAKKETAQEALAKLGPEQRETILKSGQWDSMKEFLQDGAPVVDAKSAFPTIKQASERWQPYVEV